MRDGIIFVAGIYGVGKSTLCERLKIVRITISKSEFLNKAKMVQL